MGCFEIALISSEQFLKGSLDKSLFWNTNHQSLNKRQIFVINYLYDNYDKEVGYLRTSSYAKLAKTSTDTALRDLQDLVAKGIAKEEDSGKKTNYLLISPKGLRIPKINTNQ